ncbi:MAG TPA: hypothetical protein VHB47_22405 [Thermoanaerobaculia bacterium]|jgi:hypothetical protein|nr:hypothetical protein [Thermoanaerobaculia bacterium]
MRNLKAGAMLWLFALGLSAAAAVNAQAPKVCLVGVSKDLCNVRVLPLGRLTKLFECTHGPCTCTPPGCKTIENPERLVGSLQPNARCDETTPDLNGATLTSDATFVLRLNPPLPQRGFWSAPFSLVGPGGTAAGTINATLGVGTHRKACDTRCDAKCEGNCPGASCEDCYDVVFDPVGKVWKTHTEGTMEGTISKGRYATCKIHWSFQGAFTSAGAAAGPPEPNFRSFCGTIDGVLECPCT